MRRNFWVIVVMIMGILLLTITAVNAALASEPEPGNYLKVDETTEWPLKIEPEPGEMIWAIWAFTDSGDNHEFSVMNGYGPQEWGGYRVTNLHPHYPNLKYVFIDKVDENAVSVVGWLIVSVPLPTSAPPDDMSRQLLPFIVNQ